MSRRIIDVIDEPQAAEAGEPVWIAADEDWDDQWDHQWADRQDHRWDDDRGRTEGDARWDGDDDPAQWGSVPDRRWRHQAHDGVEVQAGRHDERWADDRRTGSGWDESGWDGWDESGWDDHGWDQGPWDEATAVGGHADEHAHGYLPGGVHGAEDQPVDLVDEARLVGLGLVDTVQTAIRFLDELPTRWMSTLGPVLIRLGLGLCFLWFGALKLAPGTGPADALVKATFDKLFLPPTAALYGLALFEVAVGIALLLDLHRRALAWILIAHLAGTALPLILLPDLTWTAVPHRLTLEGQYIVKNLVLIGGALALGGSGADDLDQTDPLSP